VVEMALHGPCQIFHESMEKTKDNQANPPTPKILEEIARHEIDLMPDADEDLFDLEVDPNEEITGIELYQASIAVR
jgi:hypothetical protein